MIFHFFRRPVLALLILYVLPTIISAQDQLVEFLPFGEPKYCEGCGHAGSDYWKVTIRLKNVSGTDLILYGQTVGDEFYGLSGLQRRNPNTCEWEYGYGEPIRRIPWTEMPDHQRVPRVLKAGEIIDSNGDFSSFEGRAAKRYSAFISRVPDVQPTEIFSTPFEPVFAETPGAATFRLVDYACTAQCKIGISESPKIGGVQLGMSLKEFRSLYPKARVETIYKRPDTYKIAYIWNWKLDAYSINVTFINDRVEKLAPKFKSLDKARERDDFWQNISSTIGLPYFWEPFQSQWKCPDFSVQITPNENPTIEIQTPKFVSVRDRINEEAWRRK